MSDAASVPTRSIGYLAPNPSRSWWWIFCNAFGGTWYLVLVHLGALGVFLTGVTRLDCLLFPAFMLVRGLTTTVCYHRYFAHRSFAVVSVPAGGRRERRDALDLVLVIRQFGCAHGVSHLKVSSD